MAAPGGDKEADNVRVAVRCRPLNPDEVRVGRGVVVRVDQLRGEVAVQQVHQARASGERKRTFTFDTVFGFEATQVEVYNETARPIVDFVLEGYNGTIFAYGQTGTGKTYTMVGERDVPEKKGIILNSFAHIFGHIAKCEGEVQFLVRVSYLELYNEEVRDLLKKSKAPLEVRERPDVGVYVKDLSSFVVKNADEMDKVMSRGNKNRTFAVTDMNDHSSRSHVIFTTTVERCELGPDNQPHVRMGKLHLVDLAGSERQSKSGATGEQFKEMVKINLSLVMLGNVISALVDGRSTHIPYRNSLLTRLLQDSLGGNSKTVMIANIGPADYNCEETLKTLRYANRAKSIQNRTHINEDPKDAMLREFQREIQELRQRLEEASGSEEEDGEGEGGGAQPRQKSARTHRAGSPLSPRVAAMLKQQIEQERAELMARQGLAEDERDMAQAELQRREKELLHAQEQHTELEKKLQDLQSKVIVGGVNLLEQAEEQEQLLEASARELEQRKKKEAELRRQLREKEAERVDMEERYASLQEEAAAKTSKLKEVWRQFQGVKEEIGELRVEFQHENEEMLDAIRQLTREVSLQTLIIDSYVPREYQELLESHTVWNEDTGEWHMRGVAYAGNNMKRQSSPEQPNLESPAWDTSGAYLSYHVGPHKVHSLTPSSSTTARPKAASHRASGPAKSKQGRKKAAEEQRPPEQYPTSRGLLAKQKHFA